MFMEKKPEIYIDYQEIYTPHFAAHRDYSQLYSSGRGEA